MNKILVMACLGILAARSAQAEIMTQTALYQEGKVRLEGYLAWDDQYLDKRPGVLVFHDWDGLGSYEQGRARQLAELGYIALAADIYGQGVRPRNPQASSREAGRYKTNRALLRSRARAAWQYLGNHPQVDPGRIAAIGYCFGGMTVLELARSGAGIKGAVSFHGNLDTPLPAEAANFTAKVLVLHGAEDPHVPEQQILDFKNEMRAAKADWQMVYYSGAVHAFTVPEAGNDPARGAAYDATADRRSWQAMRHFLEEILR